MPGANYIFLKIITLITIVVSVHGFLANSFDLNLKKPSLFGWVRGLVQKAANLDTVRIVRRFPTLDSTGGLCCKRRKQR